MDEKRHPFSIGEPAPWFACRTRTRGTFHFDTVAGRWIVLSFFGSSSDTRSTALMNAVWSHRERFDDVNASFFGVSVDPADLGNPLLEDALPGIRFFWDFDRRVSRLYGVAGDANRYRPITYLLDPGLRVFAVLKNSDATHFSVVLATLDRVPKPCAPFVAAPQAPVLVLERIFEPELCRALVEYYERLGGRASGFMRDIDGKTRLVHDPAHKRRSDRVIEDSALAQACRIRIRRRLVPEIERAFQLRITRMERYIVSCYDAAEGGHFRPHRDNTTKGTAHRRFAVSLFLNSGEYEGGYLRFPEFGPALYTAPPGGAVVFGCSLLHEATPVTRGRRYMFLPFLYDDAAAEIRRENQKYLEPEAQ